MFHPFPSISIPNSYHKDSQSVAVRSLAVRSLGSLTAIGPLTLCPCADTSCGVEALGREVLRMAGAVAGEAKDMPFKEMMTGMDQPKTPTNFISDW